MAEARTLEIRAVRTGGAGVLKPVERDLAPPAAGEVQVRIEAAGVAYADIVLRRGLYAAARPPVTPGYDFVGRVEALGEQVEGFVIGQRVAGVTITGSYATRRNVDARWLAPAPENADAPALVAATLNGVTAFQMLHRIAHPHLSEWILVHGAAGGVGSLLLDLTQHAGVRAIGAASAGKHDVIVARGGVPIDYAREDVAVRARAISDGGVVSAFDHIGGRHLRDVSMAALRPGGVAIVYGGYDATRGGRVNPLAALDVVGGVKIPSFRLFQQSQGVAGYSIPEWRAHRADAYRADLARVLQLVADKAVTPLIGATFPLTDAAEAQRALETRRVAGKIVLIP